MLPLLLLFESIQGVPCARSYALLYPSAIVSASVSQERTFSFVLRSHVDEVVVVVRAGCFMYCDCTENAVLEDLGYAKTYD